MSDIPERLRKRAAELFAFVDKRDLGNGHQAIPYIATALHEIEQAARAEGERAGAERMREAAVATIIRFGSHSPGNDTLAATIIGAVLPSTAETIADLVRALPAPADPAKGA